jgi:hypothetical protein
MHIAGGESQIGGKGDIEKVQESIPMGGRAAEGGGWPYVLYIGNPSITTRSLNVPRKWDDVPTYPAGEMGLPPLELP